tara:strand:+ start:3959 stop:4162 length:204 start_codon:yes stop_codon:yes gene_type:complete
MNTIFSQLPNDIIMNIIKINTINTHEQEFEDFVNDMIMNIPEPDDYHPDIIAYLYYKELIGPNAVIY